MPPIIIGLIFECGQGAARCGYLSGRVRLFFRADAVFDAAYTKESEFFAVIISKEEFENAYKSEKYTGEISFPN